MKISTILKVLYIGSIFLLCHFDILAQKEWNYQIQNSHPRIWWNAESLAKAKLKFESKPFQPRAKGDLSEIAKGGWMWNNEVAVQNALFYLYTGDKESAATAIAWSKYNLQYILDKYMGNGITCDGCRWWLQEIVLVYDWCHDQINAEDKAFFQSNISAVVTRWNNETRWGTPDEPASNYNQGYMRNSFLWGVAAYGEIEQDEEFISNALDIRWNKFIEYFEEENLSGIPTEGTSYGVTMLNYMLIMFETARNIKIPLFNQEFFKRAVYFTIYHTTPGPTYYPNKDDNPFYMSYPFGDASAFFDGRKVILLEYSDFMAYASYYFGDNKLSNHVNGWFDKTNAQTESILFDYVDWRNPANMDDLPLDYYPPEDGTMGQAMSMSNWSSKSTGIHMQLVSPEIGGHEHMDGMNFQFWRNGRFLSMEVAGRGFGSGWQIPDYENNEKPLDVHHSLAHNTLLFGGEGQSNTKMKKSEVLRMESSDHYFFAAVDGTNAYKSQIEGDDRYNNLNIDQVIREFIFIRELETLIVFDRMKSNAKGNQGKTFLFHTWGKPVALNGDKHTATHYDQSIEITTLLPVDASFKLVEEGVFRKKNYENLWRLEVETNAQTEEEYFLHIIHGFDKGKKMLEVSFKDGDEMIIGLNHPELGNAQIHLTKGMESTKGAVGYAKSGVPNTLRNLNEEIHKSEVTLKNGFRWLNLDGSGNTTLLNLTEDIKPQLFFGPNPFTDNLVVSTGNKIEQISIFNPAGQQIPVKIKVNADGSTSLHINDKHSGIYFLIVESEGVIFRRKVIKK